MAPLKAPAALAARIRELGAGFDGRVGIAVQSIDQGWRTGWKADELYPQQSCSKFWVSLTALDAVDRGKVSLDERVSFDRSDLTLFHQPIAAQVLAGGYTTTLGDLMVKAITTSDNTANDKLMRSIGGPDAVRSYLARKNIASVRFYNGERALQSKIAGLIWSQSYSIGDAFYKARDALPLAVRQAAFNRYIEDPYDGASPNGFVSALARLKRGELLSPSSTARLLAIMKPKGSSSSCGASKARVPGLRPSATRMVRIGQPGCGKCAPTPMVSSIRRELDETALVRPSNLASFQLSGSTGSMTAQLSPLESSAAASARPINPPPRMMTSDRVMGAALSG